MSQVRTFIALPIPDTHKQSLKHLLSKIRPRMRSRISWTKPHNWHLTLKFLGDVDEDSIEPISEALSQIEFPSFALKPQGGGFFPTIRKPRVAWIGLEYGNREAQILAAEINAALKPLGFKPEAREFRSHLTIGRIRSDEGDNWRKMLEVMQQVQWEPFIADSFTLYKSDLKPAGPVYKPLAEFKGTAS